MLIIDSLLESPSTIWTARHMAEKKRGDLLTKPQVTEFYHAEADFPIVSGGHHPTPHVVDDAAHAFYHDLRVGRLWTSMPTALSLNIEAADQASHDHHKLSSASISSPGWKSLLRIGQGGLSKKHDANTRSNQLKLDMSMTASPTMLTPGSTTASPTPTPQVSVDQRSSYYSSTTPSTDSGTAVSPNLPPHASPPTIMTTSASSQPTFPPTVSATSKTKLKADKQRGLGRGRSKDPNNLLPHTASQQSFASGASSSRGPLSPKGVGASASRFIRRVASAPNAKGLFSSGNRTASVQTSPTKNGLLAPGEPVPPLPVASTTTSGQSYTHAGNPSTDTSSSTSSTGRPARPAPVRQWSGKKTKAKERVTNPALEGPGRVAFRRTYSSASIKVGEVSDSRCLHNDRMFTIRIDGRLRSLLRASKRSRCWDEGMWARYILSERRRPASSMP
jgi:hypothetical protein